MLKEWGFALWEVRASLWLAKRDPVCPIPAAFCACFHLGTRQDPSDVDGFVTPSVEGDVSFSQWWTLSSGGAVRAQPQACTPCETCPGTMVRVACGGASRDCMALQCGRASAALSTSDLHVADVGAIGGLSGVQTFRRTLYQGRHVYNVALGQSNSGPKGRAVQNEACGTRPRPSSD